jgi:hypothetical protein
MGLMRVCCQSAKLLVIPYYNLCRCAQPMIRVHCNSHQEADAAWRALVTATRYPVRDCELYLNGQLYTRFSSAGDDRSVLHEVRQARS